MKDLINKVISTIQSFKQDVDQITDQPVYLDNNIRAIPENNIHEALMKISPELANSYLQVIFDLQKTDRISWAGTAHEIREVLATLLRELGPDVEVSKQSWYKQNPETTGPTQKQRVKYIVQKNKSGSKEKDVIGQIDILDERIAILVRSTYNRASDAAHRFKPKQEVTRILKYFEAFALDLLNL